MGTVFTNGSLPFALKELRIEPYFDYTSDHEDTRVQAVQHKLKAGDLFFVSNRKNHSAWVEASFDVSGYVPQLWNAVTGRIRPVSYR
ncbi:hypothetical protein B1B_10930, partial [mine drainage metagenome]